MPTNQVQFSVAADAAWAPDLTTRQDWLAWAQSPFVIQGESGPNVVKMPAMLRRRAGFLGKMALEVAYECLGDRENERHTIPTIFCSRHGDVPRNIDLLVSVVNNEPVSPTHFGLAVHNANAGLFSIARQDQASHSAISAGQCTVEHGVIEACSLLADGAAQVLLVCADHRLPPLFASFADCEEQPHAWAWLMVPAEKEVIQLSWKKTEPSAVPSNATPASLAILQFYLRGDALLERRAEQRQWQWSRCA